MHSDGDMNTSYFHRFAKVKNVIFPLNKDDASGLDGFSAQFFQTFWDIVYKDVERATLEIFKT